MTSELYLSISVSLFCDVIASMTVCDVTTCTSVIDAVTDGVKVPEAHISYYYYSSSSFLEDRSTRASIIPDAPLGQMVDAVILFLIKVNDFRSVSGTVDSQVIVESCKKKKYDYYVSEKKKNLLHVCGRLKLGWMVRCPHQL